MTPSLQKDRQPCVRSLAGQLLTTLAVANMAIPFLLILADGLRGNWQAESGLFALLISGWHGIGSAAFWFAGRLFDSSRWQWVMLVALLATLPPMPFVYAGLWTTGSLGGFPLLWGPLLQVVVAISLSGLGAAIALIRNGVRESPE